MTYGSKRSAYGLHPILIIQLVLTVVILIPLLFIAIHLLHTPRVIPTDNSNNTAAIVTLINDLLSDNNGVCNNCLRPILEEGFERVENITRLLAFSDGLCDAKLGVINVSRFFPLLEAEYAAVIRFDNIRGTPDFNDPTRTNITFFPALPLPRPLGSGFGVNTPAMNGTNVLNHTRFKKFQSVPSSVGFALNLSFFQILPTDERLTVFLKNIEDRGPDNLEHRRYMAALTKSKVVGRYENRIKSFISNLYNSWVISKLPLLSTHKNRLIDFFLDIHLGTADHPPFVKAYFDDFLTFISVTDSDPAARIRTMTLHMNTNCTREYFRQRIAILTTEGLTDVITWHWIQAGMPIETVLIEAMHNIVAFSQFDNAVHLLVTQHLNRSTTPGTVGHSFLDLFKAAGQGIGFTVNFPFTGNVTSFTGDPEVLQLNVVREFMRIMLPNNLWFSKDNATGCTTNCAVHTQARHIPLLIQVRGEFERIGAPGQWSPGHLPPNQLSALGWNISFGLYLRYDASRYNAFPGKFSDAIVGGNTTFPAFDFNDTASGLLSVIAGFDHHPLDNETQIPRGDAAMIPVFPTPTYAAFGLGARRCPGEIFNQRIILELFRALQCLSFFDNCTATPSQCPYPLVPLAPFKAMPDSLFVVPNSATCPYK